MEPEEAVEFLLKRTGQKDEAAARALAKELGCLPLALEQAGAYILETGIGLSGYLSRFQERWQEILRLGRPISYRDTVATTWEISFQDVEKESPAAADLLNLLAFLAPEEIPRSLLAAGAKPLPEPLASVMKDRLELDKAVAALRRYSLIEATGDLLSVHRCVQAVTRDRLAEEGRKQWAGAAVKLLDGAFSFDKNDMKTWALCSPLLPHALASAARAERLKAAPEETSHLLNEVGLYLKNQGDFTEARSALETALSIGENIFGPDHTRVATMANNLASVLRDLGDLQEAKRLFERALQIDEKAFGKDHTSVAIRVNNLASVLQDLGDLQEAKRLFERALQIDEKTFGPEHTSVAIDPPKLASQEIGDGPSADLLAFA
jgi:tetratricopeptide (TPR) repeat protein